MKTEKCLELGVFFWEYDKLYLFLDEIQEVSNWEKVVRSLRVDIDCDIYIIGSNAKMLSTELSTLLSGRYVELEVFPLSFVEYMTFTDLELTKLDLFSLYMEYGGFPETTEMLQSKHLLNNYLAALYDSIVLNDVIKRQGLRNVELVKRVFNYILDNIGQITSVNKIVGYLNGANKEKVSTATLYNYIDGLQNAMIIYAAKPYDLKGKKVLSRTEKFYLSDLGLRHRILGYKKQDISQLLENIVYLELKRRGYEVYVGKVGSYEVDFVAVKEDSRIYVQVAYLLASEDTIEREYRSLQAIDDNYPKYLVTMDQLNFGNRQGIQWVNLIDFISGNLI